MSESELAKSFDPAAIEAHWGPLWEESGVYEPTLDPAKPSFCIQLPPPNVTGTLHMGHAFQHTIMDALAQALGRRIDRHAAKEEPALLAR